MNNMDKDIKLADLSVIWKYIKPLMPVWKKLGNDWARFVDDFMPGAVMGCVIGCLVCMLGFSMLIGSFHLLFFLTIPIALCIIITASFIIFYSFMGLLGNVNYQACNLDLEGWRYKVADDDVSAES